jgi:hypothetical protein
VCGAELYAKAASFAALNHNGNTSFWHESPQIGANSLRHFNCAGYDYAVRWRGKGVITITDGREEEHEEIDRKISCKAFRVYNLRRRPARFVVENTLAQMTDW